VGAKKGYMNWKEWKAQPGHFCAQVTSPDTCCPLGHNEKDERFCTCKVSREMAKAVRQFQHELYLETYRQFDEVERKFILRNHRSYLVPESKIGPYTRVDCRLRRGSAQIKDDGTCKMCGEKVDWVCED